MDLTLYANTHYIHCKVETPSNHCASSVIDQGAHSLLSIQTTQWYSQPSSTMNPGPAETDPVDEGFTNGRFC